MIVYYKAVPGLKMNESCSLNLNIYTLHLHACISTKLQVFEEQVVSISASPMLSK